MEQKENVCLCNLCESCIHVFKEEHMLDSSCDLNCFALDDCPHKKRKYCAKCKQVLDPEPNEEDFNQDLELLESALNNKNLKVICYTAPSIRVSIGDEFGFKPGENVEGKMVAALKQLGFYQVFDMNTAADFTILEEAHEFVERYKNNKNLPMFTSCCPGWVNYAKKVYPELIKNLSTCKSPQQMFGSLLNTYYAEKHGFKSTEMFVVSIVPCLAKKLELKQAELNTNVGQDVDLAITTKEISRFMRAKNIDLKNLDDKNFDDFFGSSTGAGAIFGNTGGVTEAVLRTIGDTLSLNEKVSLEYQMVRGIDSIRKAEIKFGKEKIKIAVVMGLKNVPLIIEELKKNPKKYHFVEVMACSGGCIGGGGQTSIDGVSPATLIEYRAKGLYECELKREHRKAHLNPAVQDIYKNYLGKIGGRNAKRILHRKYK